MGTTASKHPALRRLRPLHNSAHGHGVLASSVSWPIRRWSSRGAQQGPQARNPTHLHWSGVATFLSERARPPPQGRLRKVFHALTSEGAAVLCGP